MVITTLLRPNELRHELLFEPKIEGTIPMKNLDLDFD